jgi:hypothetical protein
MDTPDSLEWRQRCAYRLRRQWPSVPLDELEDTARQLLQDPDLAALPPERAATEWLRRGALVRE